METRMKNEIEILRQGLIGQQPVDDEVLTSAAVLGDRLEMLNFVGGKSQWSPWKGEAETRLAFIGWKIDKQETLNKLERCLVENF